MSRYLHDHVLASAMDAAQKLHASKTVIDLDSDDPVESVAPTLFGPSSNNENGLPPVAALQPAANYFVSLPGQ